MEINVAGLVSVILFYVVILVMGILAGWWTQKKAKKLGVEEDTEMMVGGRRMGGVVGTLTIAATVVGGGWINGNAEYTYTYGFVNAQAVLCYPLSTLFCCFTFARKMRDKNYVTLVDPYQAKYGRVTGALLFLPSLIGDLFWGSSILAALGATLQVILGLEHWVAVLISASVITIYTLFGGFFSVAYTDIIQLGCIFVGLWIAFPFAVSNDAVAPLSETFSNYVGHIDDSYVATYIDISLMLLFGGFVWQPYYQRAMAFKSVPIMLKASIVSTFVQLSFGIPPILFGAIGVSTNWTAVGYNMTAADAPLVVPLILQHLCPAAVSFIGLGAISAAVMSSADSCYLSSATMFAHNVYKELFRRKASARELVWCIRIGIFVCAALSVILAITVKSVYGLLIMSSDFTYVVGFPALLCALYVPWSNAYGCLLMYIVGLILRLGGGEPLLNFDPYIKYPFYNEEYGTQGWPYRTFAMLIGLFLHLTVSHLFNYLFKKGHIDRKYDFLKTFKWDDEEEKGNELGERTGDGAVDNAGFDGAERSGKNTPDGRSNGKVTPAPVGSPARVASPVRSPVPQ